MNTTRILAAAFAASIGLSAATVAQARLQLIAPPSPVQAAPQALAKAATAERGQLRAREAQPNWDALQQLGKALRARPDSDQEIDVPVFADITLTLTFDQVEDQGNGATAFYGHVTGEPLNSAVIVESNGTFSLHAMRDGKAYQVTFRGDRHEVSEIDRGAFTRGPEEPSVPRPPLEAFPKSAADTTTAATAAADTGSTIDVMVVYSPRTRQAAGGAAAMESQIALSIASTNQAYANSGMVQRLRLVHTEEIAAYTEPATLDIEATLNAVTSGTAPFQNVGALRNQYGADMVSFFVENAGDFCGVGWIMQNIAANFAPYAYNVTVRTCATSGGTLAHELGHNMGLEHDLYVSPEATHPVAQRYAHGYVSVAQRFYTTMAYWNQCSDARVSCVRINQFSDPGLTYNGAATGNATTADASRMLDETRTTVANFRASVTAPATPVVALAQSAYSVSEATASVSVVVSRTGATTGTSTVAWTTANGSAVAGSDFATAGSSAQRSGTLSFAAGETSKTIVVPIVNDTAVESNETFNISLSSPTGATLGVAAATITIVDNDTVTPPPTGGNTLQFSAPALAVSENGRTVRLTVNRSGSATAAANVRWTTANGTAIAGQDFGSAGRTTQSAGTLSWRAGDAAAKTISIPIVDNAVAEGTETFTVTLSAPSAGMALGTPSIATVTITDNDSTSSAGTELRFSLTRYSVSEAAGSVAVTVNRVDLGSGFGGAASVTYATRAGTALAGSDFVAASGTLTWAAGDGAPKTITIPIVNNTVSESAEIFTVTLSGASAGARIGTASTQVLILDDEVRTR